LVERKAISELVLRREHHRLVEQDQILLGNLLFVLPDDKKLDAASDVLMLRENGLKLGIFANLD
jgi:hypothetical protein